MKRVGRRGEAEGDARASGGVIRIPVGLLGCVAGATKRYHPPLCGRSPPVGPCPAPAGEGVLARASSGAWPAAARIRLRRFVHPRAAPKDPLRRGNALPQRVPCGPLARGGCACSHGLRTSRAPDRRDDFTRGPGGARLWFRCRRPGEGTRIRPVEHSRLITGAHMTLCRARCPAGRAAAGLSASERLLPRDTRQVGYRFPAGTSITTLKPMLGCDALVGAFILLAERAWEMEWYQLPPRSTRSVPLAGPRGFSAGLWA